MLDLKIIKHILIKENDDKVAQRDWEGSEWRAVLSGLLGMDRLRHFWSPGSGSAAAWWQVRITIYSATFTHP